MPRLRTPRIPARAVAVSWVTAALVAATAVTTALPAAAAEPPGPRALTVGTWDTDMVPWAGNQQAVVDTIAQTDLDVLALQGVWTVEAEQAILSDPRVAAKYPYSYAPPPQPGTGSCPPWVDEFYVDDWLHSIAVHGENGAHLAKTTPVSNPSRVLGLSLLLVSQSCYYAVTASLQTVAPGTPTWMVIEAIRRGEVPAYQFGGRTGQLLLSEVPIANPRPQYSDAALFRRAVGYADIAGIPFAFSEFPRNYLADVSPDLAGFFEGNLQIDLAQAVIESFSDGGVLVGSVHSGLAAADGTPAYQPEAAQALADAGLLPVFDQATYCPPATHAGSAPCAASFENLVNYPTALPVDNIFAGRGASCTRVGTFATTPVSSHIGLVARCAVFPTTPVLDSFGRPDGSPLASWTGATSKAFYRVSGQRLDVQLGGPLLWRGTFGTTQEAYVTLAKIDPRGVSQGLLLKAQTSTGPDAGAITVSYDARAKSVRVSALRLGAPSWTVYPAVAAPFADGDRLGARATSDGTVELYRNGTPVGTVALSAGDKAFFAARGGRIGLWTVLAPAAVLDDFGGGTAVGG